MRSLLDDSSVIGIVGTGYSAALSAAAAYASARQKPIVSPGATRVTFTDKTKFPYLVRSVGSDATELGGMVFAIESLGWRSVVVTRLISSRQPRTSETPHRRGASTW